MCVCMSECVRVCAYVCACVCVCVCVCERDTSDLSLCALDLCQQQQLFVSQDLKPAVMKLQLCLVILQLQLTNDTRSLRATRRRATHLHTHTHTHTHTHITITSPDSVRVCVSSDSTASHIDVSQMNSITPLHGNQQALNSDSSVCDIIIYQKYTIPGS